MIELKHSQQSPITVSIFQTKLSVLHPYSVVFIGITFGMDIINNARVHENNLARFDNSRYVTPDENVN